MRLTAQEDRYQLIRFITRYASQVAGGLTRIRLIKFLYLADVHLFKTRAQTATGYRWRFYHYGPWALEAQRDIDECLTLHLIDTTTVIGRGEAGEVTLYMATGPEAGVEDRFGLALELALRHEIDRWLRAPLNEFLDYVYFDTPPMRDAKRGEYLIFDRVVFAEAERSVPITPAPRYSSREAQKAWRKFIAGVGTDPAKSAIPRDGIMDDAFTRALNSLDAQDIPPGPLNASVEIDPDRLT